MRERLLSLVLALLALLLFAGLFIEPKPQKQLTMPSSADRREHGLSALSAWLSARDIPVHSWRKRWFELDQQFRFGHVLLSHAPYRVQNIETRAWTRAEHAYVESREADGIRNWVAQGNTLVLALTQLDPDSASPAKRRALSSAAREAALAEIFAWELLGTAAQPEKPVDRSAELDARAQALHRLKLDLPGVAFELEGEHLAWDAQVQTALRFQAVSGEPRCSAPTVRPGKSKAKPRSCPVQPLSAALPILRSARDDSAVGWWLPFGRGNVVVLSYGGIFRNGELARGGNASLAETLLRHFLKPGGRVLFDDYRYGLSEVYDPKTLMKDPRLHATLLIAGLFWLLYAVGRSNRILPISDPRRRFTSASFALALSDYFARQLSPRELAQALAGHFLERTGQQFGLNGTTAAVWARLQQEPRLSAPQVARARSLSESGLDNVELARLLQQFALQLS